MPTRPHLDRHGVCTDLLEVGDELVKVPALALDFVSKRPTDSQVVLGDERELATRPSPRSRPWTRELRSAGVFLPVDRGA